MNLEYKGINIFYTDNGKGNPVVFLHGFLETSKIWNPFISEISKENRVICIDLLGHGHTGCLGYIHSMELMADAVEAVLKHLNIIEVTFVGHSMGGYVALAFAEKNSDALKGLCLMNSTSRADTEARKQNRDRAILAVKQNHKTFIRMAIANLFRPKNRTIFSKEIDSLKDEALLMPIQGIVAALEGMKIRKDRSFLLNHTPFHKMMIASKKDPVLNFDDSVDEVKNTDVEFIDFPDGHMSHIENNNLFLQAIMYFIEKI
ncbi:alpha/beta hydrolase [Pseudalgibacter alginicilyticus]|uniref:Alpha/beta hydrolase n=1 Tax=Pseudalgibacter alginicilyticus TaxID=1736674 RepID=A0A0P0CHV0_9FLAO|nr:alpha/beta hydrolase [Pseudalgibacter alginicilyticus]ALJ05764.1 alpha/beta hydrolase [Pseudalgibacter alginicilyticus]